MEGVSKFAAGVRLRRILTHSPFKRSFHLITIKSHRRHQEKVKIEDHFGEFQVWSYFHNDSVHRCIYRSYNGCTMFFTKKNKTNNRMSSKSHPSATANKAMHCLIWRGTKTNKMYENMKLLKFKTEEAGILFREETSARSKRMFLIVNSIYCFFF